MGGCGWFEKLSGWLHKAVWMAPQGGKVWAHREGWGSVRGRAKMAWGDTRGPKAWKTEVARGSSCCSCLGSARARERARSRRWYGRKAPPQHGGLLSH